jgi:hypothetical protein
VIASRGPVRHPLPIAASPRRAVRILRRMSLPVRARWAMPLLALVALLPGYATAAEPAPFTSPEELVGWMARWYRDPQPERLIAAFAYVMAKDRPEAVARTENAFAVFAGRVFASAPSHLATCVGRWKDAVPEAKGALLWAVWLSGTAEAEALLRHEAATQPAGSDLAQRLRRMADEPPAPPLGLSTETPALVDVWWAAFYATGDSAYVARIAELVAPPATASASRHSLAVAARASLASHAREHPRVAQTLRIALARSEGAAREALAAVIAEAGLEP